MAGVGRGGKETERGDRRKKLKRRWKLLCVWRGPLSTKDRLIGSSAHEEFICAAMFLVRRGKGRRTAMAKRKGGSAASCAGCPRKGGRLLPAGLTAGLPSPLTLC